MIICYRKKDGLREEHKLQEDTPLTVGRSQDADIAIADEKVSRLHCGIRFMDGDYLVKDLGSRNGTFLNGSRVEVSKIKPGDRIRVGSTILSVEKELGKGQQTVLREVEEEMSHGKGYSTILREIIDEAGTD
jgi:pSer/pThr/pTyr-binding forkhead associated (FHA) protein